MDSQLTDTAFEGFLSGLRQCSVVAMDTETTGLHVQTGKDYLMGFSLAYRGPDGQLYSEYFPFRHEADNLEVFEKNFAARKVPVTFPRPLKVWSTKDLLIEEYENALPLEHFLKNGGGPFDDQVATVGLDAFLVCISFSQIPYSSIVDSLRCNRTCSF